MSSNMKTRFTRRAAMQAIGTSAIPLAAQTPVTTASKEPSMQLGAFSISLTVKDLGASRKFYEQLGFKEFGGNAAKILGMGAA